MERVCVTGASVVNRAGNSPEELWQHLVTGGENLKNRDCQVVVPQVVPSVVTRRMDRFSSLAMAAAVLLWRDCGLNKAEVNLERIGTVFNSVFSALGSNQQFLMKLLTNGPDMTSPIIFANTVSNACVGHVCIHLGLKGASTMLMGSSSVGYALDVVRANRVDALLGGGIEAYNEDMVTSYRKRGFYDEGDHAIALCRPLDRNRSGIRLSEGAAMLSLETYTHARKRGARIMAEIKGYGGAFSPVSPERALELISCRPFTDAMNTALRDAGLEPNQVDAVIMAAGGSQGGDLAEAQALFEVFGARATKLPVTTVKGITGETGGAASTLGVVVGVLSLQHQILPPAIGFEEWDEGIGLTGIVSRPLPGEYRSVMVNGYDIGGNVSSIILHSARMG